jgi:hypothetical protein
VPPLRQAAGKRTTLVSFWAPPAAQDGDGGGGGGDGSADALENTAAAMLRGVTGGLDAALSLKVTPPHTHTLLVGGGLDLPFPECCTQYSCAVPPFFHG